MNYTVLALLLAGSQAASINQLKQRVLAQEDTLEQQDNNESQGVRDRLSYSYDGPAECECDGDIFDTTDFPFCDFPDQCDACLDVDELYTSLGDVIQDSPRQQETYGDDASGVITWGHSGNQQRQGTQVDVYPDIYKKVDGVENNAFKSDRATIEDRQGTRNKYFEVNGDIKVYESQNGGLVENVHTCSSGSGYNDAELQERIGDSAAYAEDQCAGQCYSPEYGYAK